MKKTALLVFAFCCLGSPAFAQVGPAATGSGTRVTAPGLLYSFRYAQTSQFSNQLPTTQMSNVSGTITYSNRTPVTPFVMNYAGGYTWNLAGPDYQSGQFHRMYLGQGYSSHRWRFLVFDDVAYLPQSPTTGFSGIPGTGEVIGAPNPTSPNLSILAVNTHLLNNEARAELEHTLNYATSLLVGGTSTLLHFPDNNGIDTRSETVDGTLGRRLDARTGLLGRYVFSQYGYPGTNISMHTNTAQGGIRRRITRNLTVDAYAGPEWINSTVANLIPDQLTYAVNASANYMLRNNSYGASYIHGTNGGSGYLIGGTLDGAQGNFLRQYGQNFSVGLTFGYERTTAFTSGTTNSVFGGSQATWRLWQNMILFANYTGRSQNSTSVLPTNVLNFTLHTVSFGFGLSPRERRGRP